MTERLRTLCNRDCPDACGIIATVEEGRVTHLGGDPEHPITEGFLCYRTNQFLRRQYAPDRLTTPLMRRGGRLEPVSWDDALDFAARELLRIRGESGPASIFHYRSGGSLGILLAQATDFFFERFGPVTVKRGSICSGAGIAAQEADFGTSDSNDRSDLLNARHIFLWGKNVHTSSPHLIPLLRQAQSQGSEIVLIDPIHHSGTRIADRYLQPRPAGDFALAMAIARIVFERGWTDPAIATYCEGLDEFRAIAFEDSVADWCRRADTTVEEAEDLAVRLHDGPSTILVGWGMARRKNGAAIVRALDAIAAITGNLGVAGGGVSYYFQRRRGFRKLARGIEAAPRTVLEPMFGRDVLALDDPPVRAVWVTAGNPVAMLPDSMQVAQALRTREFVVVVDSWLSDTAELAHLVLPTTTLLEADDLVASYGHTYLGEARPVVKPPEGVKSDLEILQALSERVGLAADMRGTPEEWKKRLLSGDLEDRSVTLERLREGVTKNPLAAPILFEGRRFPTRSGRVELLRAPPPSVDGDPAFPLFLMSLSTRRSQSSQWATEPPKPTSATVHPDAAAGLRDGQIGILESKLGQMIVRIVHDEAQRRDVVIVPKGGHLKDGACANAITRAETTDLGEGGALYDERARLLPLPQSNG